MRSLDRWLAILRVLLLISIALNLIKLAHQLLVIWNDFGSHR